MPSRDARIDCGAKAKATKFSTEPVRKTVVPNIQMGDSHESSSSRMPSS